MNKVLKLHGCSGAGKTTIARALIAGADSVHEITKDGDKRPEAYVLEYPEYNGVAITVLGSYENNCGGMDSYPSDAPSIIKLIEAYRSHGHVFFEGLLLSTYYGTVGHHLKTMGDGAIMAFLDTPVLTCLERVTRRRDVQKSKNKFNPQNTVDKFNTIVSLKAKCEKLGHRVYSFQHDVDPLGQLHTLFRDAA